MPVRKQKINKSEFIEKRTLNVLCVSKYSKTLNKKPVRFCLLLFVTVEGRSKDANVAFSNRKEFSIVEQTTEATRALIGWRHVMGRRGEFES